MNKTCKVPVISKREMYAAYRETQREFIVNFFRSQPFKLDAVRARLCADAALRIIVRSRPRVVDRRISRLRSTLESMVSGLKIEQDTFGVKGSKSQWLHINLGKKMIVIEVGLEDISVSEVFPGEIDFSPPDKTYRAVGPAIKQIIKLISAA